MARRHWAFPIAVATLATLAVYASLQIGATLRPTPSRDRPGQSQTIVEAFSLYAYVMIARDGYDYSPVSGSDVAFFPAYPVAIWGTGKVLPLSLGATASGLAAVLFGLAMVVFYRYLLGRAEPQGADLARSPPRQSVARYAVLALALWPTAFYFHIPYSESTFLLFAALSLLAMQQHWNLVAIAFLVGLVTATRPVGVALVPCFLLHVWSRLPRSPSYSWAAIRPWLLAPLACWGLLAYMAYQWIAFDEPLAFAKTQQHWTVIEIGGWTDRLVSLVSLEPVWGTYLSTSPYRWQQFSHGAPAFASLSFANPIYWAGGVALVFVGMQKRWLNHEELLLAAGLIFIAYTTRGYEWGTLSQGRFMSAVLPIYIVIGEILARLPRPAAVIALMASGGMMLLHAFQQGGGGN